MGDPKPFADLLDDLRNGDEHAAAQIVEEYTDALVAVARRQMGAKLARRLDAEDIVQSTYRSLFIRIENGEYELGSGRDLWKLLVTMALNKVRRKSKYHRAAKRNMNLDQSVVASAAAPLAYEARASGPTPDDAAALVDELQAALERIPERDRQIIELRLQGCSTAEISEQVGRAERSVRRVVQRLGDLLRHAIEE